MDIETIDARYSQLQTAAQQIGPAVSDLAAKMQTAAGAGDANAREWLLDLKGLALQVKDEQDQANNLLQAMHDYIVNTLQAHEQLAEQAQAQQAQQPPPQQPYYQGGGYGGGFGGGFGGGGLQRFVGSGFGRAIAMGAGFGLGDDLISKIF